MWQVSEIPLKEKSLTVHLFVGTKCIFKFQAVGHRHDVKQLARRRIYMIAHMHTTHTGASEWRIPLAQWNKTPTRQINNQERKGVKAKKINTIKSHVWRSEWPQNEDAYVHFSFKSRKTFSVCCNAKELFKYLVTTFEFNYFLHHNEIKLIFFLREKKSNSASWSWSRVTRASEQLCKILFMTN